MNGGWGTGEDAATNKSRGMRGLLCYRRDASHTFHDPVPVPRADGEPPRAVQTRRVLEGAPVGGGRVGQAERGRQGRHHHDRRVAHHRCAAAAVHHAVA